MSKSALPQPEAHAAGLTFHRSVRWLALVGLLLAATLVAGRYLLFDELDEQIRVHVENWLKSRFADCQVEVTSARRIPGKGILVRGVSIKTLAGGEGTDEDRAPSQASILIDELEIQCPTDLASFWQQDVALQRLIIRRAEVSLFRRTDGSWQIPRPLMESSQQALPQIQVEDGVLRCWDVRKGKEKGLLLRKINGELIPPNDSEENLAGLVRFRGQCESDRFQQLVLAGDVQLATGVWQARGAIQSLRVTTDSVQTGPWELPFRWPVGLDLRCCANVQWAVQSPSKPVAGDQPSEPAMPAAGDWHVTLQADVVEGHLQDPRLPYPLTDIQASVQADSTGINIRELVGRCGTSDLTVEFQRTGWMTAAPWRLHAKVKQLTLNEQFASKLPATWRKNYDRFSPQGHVDLDLTLQSSEERVHTNLKVECQNTSFVYDRFPYPLESGRGLVQWADGVLVIDGFRATAHGQLVRIDGRIEDPEKFSKGWVEVSTAGSIPLDAPLLNALNPSTRASITALHPTGMVTLHRARFERNSSNGGPLHQQIDLELHDCSIKPEKFPYPINRIRGRIMAEDRNWQFQEIVGHSGGAYVQCEGSWQQGSSERNALVLNVTATDVPLNNTLREAIIKMNPRTGRVWEDLQPQGTLDRLTVQLRHPGLEGKTEVAVQGQKWPRQVYVPDPGLLVKPAWFPYRIDHVTGMFNYHKGQVVLSGIRGQHGKSVVRLDATCFFPSQGPWDAKLSNLTVDNLLADHEFVAALPLSIRNAVKNLNVTGPLMLRGQLQLAQAIGSDREIDAQWDLKIEGAGVTIDSGVRLDSIHGGVRLFGLYDKNGFRSRGDLDIDSVFFRKEQLTSLQGPMWIDSRQVLFGAWSRHQAESRKPQSVTAKTLGGRLALDAQLITGSNARFFLQAGLQQGDLAYILNQRGVKAKVTGKADASLQLSGTPAGVHTWNGRGAIRLRNADIYEVPLMVALLSLVSVRPPDTTAFTSSDINYRIQSDRIFLDRIQFNGDAISLKGNGWLDFDQKINLSFYTLVGRNELRIPVVSSLLDEASRNLLKIQVVGTLNKPRISGSAFPELDERMQSILNDLNRPRADPIERLPRTGAE